MFDDQKVIRGIHYQTKQPIEILLENTRIKSIQKATQPLATRDIVAPGLVDLQINGFMNIDFNNTALTTEEWIQTINNLSAVGVTTFYPTIITNSFKQLSYIFEETVKQLQGTSQMDAVGGFHLEGPYISEQDGPRGAHVAKYVRRPSWDEFCQLQEKAQGLIKVVTLSPEWPESYDFIKKATKSGVRIAIGHTNANSEQIGTAVEAGATLSTHLGNGAHPVLPRHPNYIWDQLAEEQLWTTVISDNHHIPKNVLKTMEQVKKEKMILISDCVALAGMEPGQYKTSVGGEVTLLQNGRLHLTDHYDLLAGSANHLLQGVKNFVDNHITDLGEAWNKASIYPSRFMGCSSSQGISQGSPADLVLFRNGCDGWDVMETYKNGNMIYKKHSC